jgi:phosphoglycerol transferase MdoB-like AlkP superfamily enzyme
MKEYFKLLVNILYKLGIIVLLYSVSRIFFFIDNYGQFSQNTFIELAKVFIYGIRFDASAIIEINLLFVFFWALPFKFAFNKRYIRILDIIFIVVNGLILVLNYTDAEYFKFTAKRSTADLFNYIFMSNDAVNLMPQFLKDFWYVPLGWAITLVLGIFLLRWKPLKINGFSQNNLKNISFSFFLMIVFSGLLIVTARGLNYKPIRIISATRYTTSENVPLILNTPFCIIHTFQEEETQSKKYFPEDQLKAIFNPEQFIKSDTARHDNIVFIILESLSRDFVGSLTGRKTYTPCLDSIIGKSLVFENAFANGKKSIDAMPAIFAGLLPIYDEPFISSQYAGDAMEALPKVLSGMGYHTSFFHGGRNGTMGFDEFANVAGIKNYYGLNEYQGSKAFDGNWGIYDEEFFQFFASRLNTFHQPFMSSIFSLSFHHPYSIPEKYKNKYPADETDLLKSLRYSDEAVGKFFRTVAKMPWYKNTLFIITADHTARHGSNTNDNSLKAFRIPIIFYHPGNPKISGKSTRIMQQTDIMPSVFEYLGINKPFVSFGNSIFSEPDSTAWAEYYLGGIYKYVEKNVIISFDGEKVISANYMNPAMDSLLGDVNNKDIVNGMEMRLKAIIQQCQSRIVNNRLVIKK